MTSVNQLASGPEQALGATLYEGEDAPSNIETGYTIAAGDTFFGQKDAFDTDWIELSVVAGETYFIELYGATESPVFDTYLGLFSGDGTFLLGLNDDNGLETETNPDLYSELTYLATQTGSIFIEVDTYEDDDEGGYQVSVSHSTSNLKVGTFTEMAAFMTDTHWTNRGETRHAYDTATSNEISVDIGSLTAEGQQLARWAFEAWEMVANIDFVEVGAGADITFDDDEDGLGWTYDYADGTTTSTDINVSSGFLTKYGTTIYSDGFMAYLNTIGGSLGLGNPGNYYDTFNFATDAVFLNDSLQLSTMSFVSGGENPNVSSAFGWVVSAQMVDIIAIQDLYGAPVGGATAGDTTYGEGSNLGNYFDDLSGQILFTIFDEGGEDRIDLSGSLSDTIVNLNGGTFSSIEGELNNMGIAVGTVIENLFLGSGDDTVTANAAANIIETGGGSDTIFGVNIGDVIDGGAGFDTMYIDFDLTEVTDGGESGAVLTGSNAFGAVSATNVESFVFNDQTLTRGEFSSYLTALEIRGLTITGSAGNDALVLGSGGDDIINARAGSDTVDAAAGDDAVRGGIGSDTIYGGSGLDTIRGDDGFDTLHGDGENDVLSGNNGNDTVYGGSGADSIYGGLGADQLFGDEGNDFISADNGFDVAFGGFGDDTMFGNNGNDTLYGDDGEDFLNGGLGADRLFGGSDDDAIIGLAGSDYIDGGFGNDTLSGNNGNDVVYGGLGDDIINGGLANDTLYGGDDADSLSGANGRDLLFGGFGDDMMSGGAGNDILHGDEGRDVLTGGSGADAFHFRVGSGLDTITDFTNGVDILFLDENLLLGATEDFDINDYATLTDGNLTLQFMIEETIIFTNGITAAQLSGNIEFEDISLN